jgi:mRNA-degrading endonuclease RelE of RelBE toxin-antitoxin system
MWTVILSSRFKKSFKKIDKDYQSKIEKFILLLQNGFYPEGFDIKKLEGGENEYREK